MNDLIKSKLIIRGDNNNYLASERGKEFLIRFNDYSMLFKDINEKVNRINDQRLILNEMCPVEKLITNDQKKLKAIKKVNRGKIL
jgi:hypothetical protein